MAYYKYGNLLKQENGGEYDSHYHPGAEVPISGVYRCRVCGLSTTAVAGKRFPPQHTTHQHPTPIDWQLVVKSHFVGGG